jgi:hypothetical protein
VGGEERKKEEGREGIPGIPQFCEQKQRVKSRQSGGARARHGCIGRAPGSGASAW